MNLKDNYMDYSIINRRVTIFTERQLTFDEDGILDVINKFADLKLLPSISKGFQVKFDLDKPIGKEVLTLNLKRIDNSLVVEFNPERIDIISNIDPYSWEDFNKETRSILIKLVENLEIRISRIALGANVRYSLSKEIINSAYNKLVPGDEENTIEWIIRNVVRSNLSLNEGTIIQLNNVYTLSKIETNSDFLNLELDFNTIVGSNSASVTSNRDIILDDFVKSMKTGIGKYNHLFESWK